MASFFNGIRKLEYGNKVFFADKFSGFSKVDFRYKLGGYGEFIKIQYFIELYFSGHTLELCKNAFVDVYTNKKSFFFKENTKEFDFIHSLRYKNAYQEFIKSNYKSGKPTDIINDYVRWFAVNTNTMETLNNLKNDIEFCFGYVDETLKERVERNDN